MRACPGHFCRPRIQWTHSRADPSKRYGAGSSGDCADGDYLWMISWRRWAKVLCGVYIAILTLVIVHAQSRTSNIAYGAALGALAFRGVWLRMEGR